MHAAVGTGSTYTLFVAIRTVTLTLRLQVTFAIGPQHAGWHYYSIVLVTRYLWSSERRIQNIHVLLLLCFLNFIQPILPNRAWYTCTVHDSTIAAIACGRHCLVWGPSLFVIRSYCPKPQLDDATSGNERHLFLRKTSHCTQNYITIISRLGSSTPFFFGVAQ